LLWVVFKQHHSSNPWTQNIFPLICVFFNVFHKCLIDFSLSSPWLNLFPHIFFYVIVNGIFFFLNFLFGQFVVIETQNWSHINVFSNHSGMKLEINNRRKTGKFTNMWEVNNMLLNIQWVKEEIWKRISKSILRQMKKETQYTKTFGDAAKEVLRSFSGKCLHFKRRKNLK